MWNVSLFADEAKLAAAWRSALPFPHLIFDDFVDELPELFAVLDEEPVDDYRGDIFAFEASTPEPRTKGLVDLRTSFADTLAGPLSRITGKTLRRADMRAYAYRPGHYLLPHSDHQADVGRALAYAYYLPSPEPPVGGELEMYRVTPDLQESALVIPPLGNRLVVFDVSDISLHQVREVLGGLRVSLAGWFHP